MKYIKTYEKVKTYEKEVYFFKSVSQLSNYLEKFYIDLGQNVIKKELNPKETSAWISFINNGIYILDIVLVDNVFEKFAIDMVEDNDKNFNNWWVEMTSQECVLIHTFLKKIFQKYSSNEDYHDFVINYSLIPDIIKDIENNKEGLEIEIKARLYNL